MSEKLDKIMDGNLSQEDIDAILGDSIRAKFDADLKLELQKDLKIDYQLSKEGKVVELNVKSRRKRIYYIMAVAAGFALLILALNFFGLSSDNPQTLAFSYLEAAEIYHGGALKGSTKNQDIRMQAISAFNADKYTKAEEYFEQIEDKTEEDIFYSGIASLYDKKYEASIRKLASVSKTGTNYKAEARWYLAIAYILHGEEAKAKDLLSKMDDSTWNYDKTQALLQVLK